MNAVYEPSHVHQMYRANDGYEEFMKSIQNKFNATQSRGPLFTTNASNLWHTYLDNLPAYGRQHYNCHSCRRFIERYGGLTYITETGIMIPAIWNGLTAPPFFDKASTSLFSLVSGSRVTGVFVSSNRVLGTPVTEDWSHLHVVNNQVWSNPVANAAQRMAELRQDYLLTQSALQEYRLGTLKQVLGLLQVESLYRGEKIAGPVQWLHDLHIARASADSRIKDNLTWLAVAKAPAGFTHVKTGVAGTLLADVQSGMSIAQAKSRFDAKMNPVSYRRPQAAPSLGNIQQANRLAEQLNITSALERRFARLDEVVAIWRPVASLAEVRGPSAFSSTLARNQRRQPRQDNQIPEQTLTFEKFRRTVLPSVLTIECKVQSHDSFAALTTAVHLTAEPILQWDSPWERNPVSSYTYANIRPASQWNLAAEQWVTVNAICLNPAHWFGESSNQANAVYFILNGAKDVRYRTDAGNCLFPETLKSVFHPIRSTIEAYNKTHVLSGYDEANACGLLRGAGNTSWNTLLKVTTNLGTLMIRLDRWD